MFGLKLHQSVCQVLCYLATFHPPTICQLSSRILILTFLDSLNVKHPIDRFPPCASLHGCSESSQSSAHLFIYLCHFFYPCAVCCCGCWERKVLQKRLCSLTASNTTINSQYQQNQEMKIASLLLARTLYYCISGQKSSGNQLHLSNFCI